MELSSPVIPWIIFHVLIVIALWIDLYWHTDSERGESVSQAMWISAAWIALALFFGVGIFYGRGVRDGSDFIAAYLVEKALSVDNLFIFLVLFRTFGIPVSCQRRILLWGVLGAVIMRALFIFAGIALIARFEWILYLFAGCLLVLAYQLLTSRPDDETPRVALALKRWIPIADDTKHFWVKTVDGWRATPSLLALLAIEFSDVVFAIDSIPAVMGITRDPFIAYTSNIFAVLGLRSLYFALVGFLELFSYLHYGLALILAFIAVKILISPWYHFPNLYSLLIIAVILGLSALFSVWKTSRE